ncbi:hypothetical protein MS3_00001264 [Schistosoma haematobium]|uniref:Uncharacterized protein n=1 Tax=Schistosoma haematobium TaxID=6185 RepID=A0A922S410_SCHHA|nr:hypothetical protein MS3_00001264 [Schistosoma haematobium]KAH9592444.1 hypothetical protein MS3_00001264 [Schistosoma haematobium]
MKLKLKKQWTSEETPVQRFNTNFLRHTDILDEFNDKFQTLQDLLKDEVATVEHGWEGIKEASTSTCYEVLFATTIVIGNESLSKSWTAFKKRTRKQQLTNVEQEQRKARHKLNTEKQTSK